MWYSFIHHSSTIIFIQWQERQILPHACPWVLFPFCIYVLQIQTLSPSWAWVPWFVAGLRTSAMTPQALTDLGTCLGDDSWRQTAPSRDRGRCLPGWVARKTESCSWSNHWWRHDAPVYLQPSVSFLSVFWLLKN